MSEPKHLSASDISREAKGLNQGLQESLKSKDPFDKDVEFQRKNIRRHYVRLLLVHPYSKESKDAETRLWMQTSYAFIAIYKHRIARVDPANPARGPRQGRRDAQSTIVEYRKLLSRFRQFLAEEEKFWIQLVVRFRRSFGLDEVHPALVALELIPPDVEEPSGQQSPDSGGRGQNLFPIDDVSVIPSTEDQRQDQLSIVSKALVCLGDIARYREQYNEKGGRPKAGHEAGPPAKKNDKKNKANTIIRSRDYEKAQQRYEQARALVPNEGNPSHQLAILASYQRDTFGSLVHYYRALCVQQPYETAAENMDRALSKALDHWKASGADRAAQQPPIAARLRIDALKDKIVVLHAYWASGKEEMDNSLLNDVTTLSRDLVSERLLSTEIISKLIILAQGALWKHKMLRPSGGKRTPFSLIVEGQMATHILAMHRALLEVGCEELEEAPPEDSEDLAQNITATFRRTLPALRMASKWIRANFKYFTSDSARELPIHGVPDYWEAYARFSSALERKFPLESLPHLETPLDEDQDVNGFLPLAKLMVTRANAGAVGNDKSPVPRTREQVHPNEEQLMRLWDLLTDARVIVESQDAPIVFRLYEYFVKGQEGTRRISEKTKTADSRDVDEDTESSRTDDDPIRDAFRKVLEGSEVDDDDQVDEIVWDPRVPVSPTQIAIESGSLPPPLSSPMAASPKSLGPTQAQVKPIAISPASKSVGTTAQDLLNNVMGLSTSHSEPATKSPLLFGSTSGSGSSHSIWSTSLTDSEYPGVNNHHQRSRSQYAPPGSPFSFSHLPLDSSQPAWQSSHNFQPSPIGTSLAPQPHPVGHQRMHSTSTPSAFISQSPYHQFEQFGVAQSQPFSHDPGLAALSSHSYPSPPSRQGFAYGESPASYGLTPSVSRQLWGNVG